ncbi:fimbrial protein [Pseudomonas capeferrum]|uniref:fimbrial protein n=1 Tax=Pseudomonas capeferrum TaxID=1495066 RepID=UPI0015E34464|nr:fimbrial protein [Pseudomonas capeferrum]MBA1205197.1 fimbrial protein [Pseudomonas capeferrum]
MKKIMMTLALSLASSTAFAADETGRINFHGSVYAGGTCPIEVVDPGAGVLPWVSLGNYLSKYFTTPGTATPDVAFALRVTPDATCVIAPNAKAKITFESLHGPAGTGGEFYAVRGGGATHIAVEIKDEDKNRVEPLDPSKEYDLYSSQPTDLKFYAAYVSTGATVGEGLAEAEVNFKVELP